MIVIGYQGIGKSTLARERLQEHGMSEYIDLESSCFWHDGKRPDDWYIYYCQMAEYLSREGFCVFVSSHEVVREQLRNSKERVVIICPSLELKEDWLMKLEKRYTHDVSDKNYKAWMNAEDRYEENIKELLSDDFDTFLIESLDYDLDGIIDHAKTTRLGNNAGQGEGYVERIIEVLKQQKIPYPSYYKDKELNDAIDYAVCELLKKTHKREADND